MEEWAFMPVLQHKELKGFSPGENESSIVISTWKLSDKYALALLVEELTRRFTGNSFGGRAGIYARVTAQRIEGASALVKMKAAFTH